MDWHAVVGGNIRRIRESRGATQEEAAFAANINAGYLGKVERGQKNPTLKLLVRIGLALDVPPNAFFRTLKKK